MAKFLTNVGKEKLLTASPLTPLQIKSVVVGTGSSVATESITALQNEVWRGNASDPIKQGTKLGFTTLIPLDVGTWSLTEWGWIDGAGDLIAYGQFDIPVYKEAGIMALEPTLYIELSNTTDSDLFITEYLNWPHNSLTGRSEVDAHPISSITGLTKAIGLKSNKITASKVLTVDDYGAFDVDASAGNIVITMPDVSLVASNNYVFTRTDNTANTVFFQPFGTNKFIAEGIAGANSRLLQYETSWFKKLDVNNWVGGRSVQEQLTTISGKPWLINKGAAVDSFLMSKDLINDLVTGGANKALTAEQGKLLFEMFNNNLDNNGFIKIPNPTNPEYPVIFQWIVGGSDSVGRLIVTNPITFPNKLLGGIANESNSVGWASNNVTSWGFDSTGSTNTHSMARVRQITIEGVARAYGSSGRILVWGY